MYMISCVEESNIKPCDWQNSETKLS